MNHAAMIAIGAFRCDAAFICHSIGAINSQDAARRVGPPRKAFWNNPNTGPLSVGEKSDGSWKVLETVIIWDFLLCPKKEFR